MQPYDIFYHNLTAPLRRRKKLIHWLDRSNKGLTLIMYLAYAALLGGLFAL